MPQKTQQKTFEFVKSSKGEINFRKHVPGILKLTKIYLLCLLIKFYSCCYKLIWTFLNFSLVLRVYISFENAL